VREVATSLVLVAIALAVSFRSKLGLEKDLGFATLRALIQLAVVAALIDLVFEESPLAAGLVVLMAGIAAWTSSRRMKGVPGAFEVALTSIVLSAGVAMVVMFATSAFPFEPRWLIPIGGIAIGNCMNATSLAGSRLRDEIVDKTLEVEARLALGVSAKEALKPYARRAATTGLIPIIDATKNVGIIVLPGAFVGMILGGASPRDAAELQLVVLFMLLGAVSVAGMATTVLVARRFVGSGERIVIPRTADGSRTV
jgi:putative ABC transport system permease protein